MRWIRRTAAVLMSMLLLWLGLALSGWLPPIPEANREALRVLRQPSPWPATQGNAFRGVWLAAYDIPPAEREAFAAMAPDAMVAALLERTPAVPGPAAWPAACAWYRTGCVAALREAAVAVDADDLRRVRALYRHDHLRNLSTPMLSTPTLPLQGFERPARAAAVVAFDAGEHGPALALLCEDAAFWRRLRANTDLLLVDMLGTALLSADATAFAELLAELPRAGQVPAICSSALEPLSDDELMQCRTFRGEFAALEHGLDREALAAAAGDDDSSHWLSRPLFQREHMLAKIAPAHAAFCSQAHAARAAARAAFPRGQPAPEACSVFEYAFNAVGCILGSVATPGLSQYYDRVLDLDSRLKLVSSALWLRGQPAGQPLSLLFDTRPLALREEGAELVQDEDGARLRVPLRHPRGGIDHYEIPVRLH